MLYSVNRFGAFGTISQRMMYTQSESPPKSMRMRSYVQYERRVEPEEVGQSAADASDDAVAYPVQFFCFVRCHGFIGFYG